MTHNEFTDRIRANRIYDFEFNGTNYVISMEEGKDGKQKIFYGEQYMPPEEYENFTHLMADARIQNHYLREVISVLS